MPVSMHSYICTDTWMTSSITRVESILPIPSSELKLSEDDLLLLLLQMLLLLLLLLSLLLLSPAPKLDSSLSLFSLSSLCIRTEAYKERVIPCRRSRRELRRQKDMMSWGWTTHLWRIKGVIIFLFFIFWCLLFTSGVNVPKKKLCLSVRVLVAKQNLQRELPYLFLNFLFSTKEKMRDNPELQGFSYTFQVFPIQYPPPPSCPKLRASFFYLYCQSTSLWSNNNKETIFHDYHLWVVTLNILNCWTHSHTANVTTGTTYLADTWDFGIQQVQCQKTLPCTSFGGF